MNILFMCVANSARSQMAEGLARKILGSSVTVESAGSQPTQVNSFAIKALSEVNIDASKHYSKIYSDLKPGFIATLDYVITLCSEEVCPQISSQAKKLHWPLPDPAAKLGTELEKLNRFRETRDSIAAKIRTFAAENGLRVY